MLAGIAWLPLSGKNALLPDPRPHPAPEASLPPCRACLLLPTLCFSSAADRLKTPLCAPPSLRFPPSIVLLRYPVPRLAVWKACPPPSTVNRPSSILRSAVRRPRSVFVPDSLTVCSLPRLESPPLPLSTVHSTVRDLYHLSTLHHLTGWKARPAKRRPPSAARRLNSFIRSRFVDGLLAPQAEKPSLPPSTVRSAVCRPPSAVHSSICLASPSCNLSSFPEKKIMGLVGNSPTSRIVFSDFSR